MQIYEIIEQIKHICQEHQAHTVTLFGSRAKGTASAHSDFDIAVSGVLDIEDLRDSLDEIPTLYKIDLVDLDTCKNNLLFRGYQAIWMQNLRKDMKVLKIVCLRFQRQKNAI